MKISTKLILTAVVAVACMNSVEANFMARMAARLRTPVKLGAFAAAGTFAYNHPKIAAYFAKKDAARAAQYPHAKGTPAEVAAATGGITYKEARAAAKETYSNFVESIPGKWRMKFWKGLSDGYANAKTWVKAHTPAQVINCKDQAQVWFGARRVQATNWFAKQKTALLKHYEAAKAKPVASKVEGSAQSAPKTATTQTPATKQTPTTK